MWSPDTSTAFASVANDGRIEVWDLYENNLTPRVTHFDKDKDGNDDHTPKTIVRFTPKFNAKSPVLMTGNTKGEVDVYRVKGLEHKQVLDQDQWARMNQAIKKDDYSESKKKDGEEGGEE